MVVAVDFSLFAVIRIGSRLSFVLACLSSEEEDRDVKPIGKNSDEKKPVSVPLSCDREMAL